MLRELTGLIGYFLKIMQHIISNPDHLFFIIILISSSLLMSSVDQLSHILRVKSREDSPEVLSRRYVGLIVMRKVILHLRKFIQNSAVNVSQSKLFILWDIEDQNIFNLQNLKIMKE